MTGARPRTNGSGPARVAGRRSRIAAALVFMAFCLVWSGAEAQPAPFDLRLFQPEIVTDVVAERPLRGSYSLANNTDRVGLARMRAQVPGFDGKGLLIASWNPHPDGTADRPTFVIVHGGHGLVPTNFATALWARRTFEANVLVLDSYWSRGREENWATWTPFGANMRALDAIAAGRWLTSVHGVDPRKMVLIGDSQGGWTVLRTFTDEPFLRRATSRLYRAGVALYPNCRADGSALRPRLGPYGAPVIVFTGGKDTATPVDDCDRAVFRAAASWKHYPDATHGWDVANRGAHSPAVDGECGRALNVYNRFSVCRSDAVTADMQVRITAFLFGIGVRPPERRP